jgi:putative ABC transport system substrate-binding protein
LLLILKTLSWALPVAAFLDELRKLGFTDGQNLIIDRKSTAQHLDALVTQALEMARASSDVLVALGSETTLQACARASQSIPIVFVANNYDPIARGYVNSLRRPGGNITGVFLRQTELAQKASRDIERSPSRSNSIGCAVGCDFCRPVRGRRSSAPNCCNW